MLRKFISLLKTNVPYLKSRTYRKVIPGPSEDDEEDENEKSPVPVFYSVSESRHYADSKRSFFIRLDSSSFEEIIIQFPSLVTLKQLQFLSH